MLAAIVAAPSVALGQDQPVQRREPVRRPIIDLEKQAQERRPGQVMPGDGVPDYVPPEKTPAAPEPAPAPIEAAPEAAQPAAQGAPADAPVLHVQPSAWVTAPVEVKVGEMSAVGRMAQWRTIGAGEEVGVWTTPIGQAVAKTGAEIRTGLGAETMLEVEGWQITIDRLTKAAILGAVNQEDGSRRVEIHLDRGQVQAVPGPGASVPLVVITADTVVPVEAGVSTVSEDAFRGTRVR